MPDDAPGAGSSEAGESADAHTFQFDLDSALRRLETAPPRESHDAAEPAGPSTLETTAPSPRSETVETPEVGTPAPPPVAPPVVSAPAPVPQPVAPVPVSAVTPTPPLGVPVVPSAPAAAAPPVAPPAAPPADPAPVLQPVQAADQVMAPAPSAGPSEAPLLPRRERAGSPVSGATQPPPPPVRTVDPDGLPRRDAPTPTPTPTPTAPVRPIEPGRTAVARQTNGQRRSVFDDAAPAPQLPSEPTPQPAEPTRRPVIPSSVAQHLPSLPAANPVVTPIVVEAASPVGPDLQAVRAFERTAHRARRRSKVAGHSLLAVVVLAGLVAAALVFGRPLLFPDEWDASLTPIVDRVQTRTGAEFTEVVPLSELPDDEYAAIALSSAFGADWDARFAEWRALGIASGEPAGRSVTAAVVAMRPAVYDPVSNTVYRAESADPDALPAAYEVALGEIFHRQQATPPNDDIDGDPNPVLGVRSAREISSAALDRVLSGARAEPSDVPADAQAPLPVVYELAAVDRLGDALRGLAGPVALSYGDVYPDQVLDATVVEATRATGGTPLVETEVLADPVALGLDAWSMIWQNRLPEATVIRLRSAIVADSYTPVERGGEVCIVANFLAVSPEATPDVAAGLARWALAAPVEAQATVTTLDEVRVEVVVCDPGGGVEQEVDTSAVDDTLVRRIDALGAAAG